MGRRRGEETPAEERFCASCGRRIEWRAKWARDWDQVRYCSTACRRHGLDDTDRALQEHLRDRLRRGTADPADAAAAVGGDDPASLREPARRAARRLVASGDAEVVQGGRVVDASTAKGPFTLRRPR